MNNGSDHTTARWRREPILDEFELALQRGDSPLIESFLMRAPDSDREHLFRDLFDCEIAYRRRRGEAVNADEYLARFPEFSAIIDQSLSHTAALPKRKPPDAASLNPGDVVAERYLILDELGKGGMGQVFKAQDTQLRQTVALKFLFKERATDKEWIERLKEEVKLAQTVSHVNVCRVHHYQESEQGSFLVMEFAATGSLANLLAISGQIGPEIANRYARELCDGLAEVHKVGLLHRDLKPGNVLLHDKKVKLADFGLAAIAERLGPKDAYQGTRQYMAPELLDGRNATDRSDIHALGAVLYEMVTGRRPFVGKSELEIRNLQRSPPVRPSELVPGLDPAFDGAILPCLESDPEKRPASPREVKDRLPPLSPRDTADIPGTVKLRPLTALALAGIAILGFLLHATIADRTMAYRQLSPMHPPARLEGEAARHVESILGREPSGNARFSGIEWDLDLLKELIRRKQDWRLEEQQSLSPLAYFWLRISPEHHAPSNRLAPTDPPLASDGMICLMLAPNGRLLEYHAVPSREPGPVFERNRDANRGHWETLLLGASGLSRSSFAPGAPHRRPAVFADDVWALDEIGGTKSIEFAVCSDANSGFGQLVYYQVREPLKDGKRPDRTEGENMDANSKRKLAGGPFTLAVMLFAGLAAGPLAWRNWRLGRADVTGSLRLVGLYFVTSLLGWLLTTDHVPSLHVERVLLMNNCGIVAFWGAILFVSYLAIEPYMRQRWPERLSSWNRVLHGGLGNPLVGRDVLIGLIAGVLVALPFKLASPVAGTYYLVSSIYDPQTPNVTPGFSIAVVSFSLVRTTGMFVLLLLLGLVLRREWLIYLVLALILTKSGVQPLLTFDEAPALALAGSFVCALMLVLTAARFGWLASQVCFFTATVLNIMPLTFAPDEWYVGATAHAAIVLSGLTLYGLVVSVGAERLIPERA